jgi:hypothetical protein
MQFGHLVHLRFDVASGPTSLEGVGESLLNALAPLRVGEVRGGRES